MLRGVRGTSSYRFQSFANAARLLPLLCLSFLCLSFLWMAAVDAQQSEAGVPSADTPTVEGPATTTDALRARMKALEAQQDMPAEDRAKLTELLNQGVAAADRADTLEVEFERLAEQRRRAPERQTEITQALALPAPTFDADLLITDTSPSDAETKLRESEAALATARQRVQNLTAALARQRQRPEAIQASLAETKERLRQLEEELKAPPVPGEPATLGEACALVLGARQQMRTLELAALEQELGGNDVLLALIGAELELAQREVASLEGALAAWQAVAQRLREPCVRTAARPRGSRSRSGRPGKRG